MHTFTCINIHVHVCNSWLWMIKKSEITVSFLIHIICLDTLIVYMNNYLTRKIINDWWFILGTKPPYGTSAKSPRTPESERKRITDPTTALKEDWRVFECNTWHLEPTVRYYTVQSLIQTEGLHQTLYNSVIKMYNCTRTMYHSYQNVHTC